MRRAGRDTTPRTLPNSRLVGKLEGSGPSWLPAAEESAKAIWRLRLSGAALSLQGIATWRRSRRLRVRAIAPRATAPPAQPDSTRTPLAPCGGASNSVAVCCRWRCSCPRAVGCRTGEAGRARAWGGGGRGPRSPWPRGIAKPLLASACGVYKSVTNKSCVGKHLGLCNKSHFACGIGSA